MKTTRDQRVTVIGPTSWNEIVQLAELPEPRTQTLFANAEWATLGGTSAGKALHLADLGVATTLTTVLGTDSEADLIRAALTHDLIDLLVETADGPSERHLNLMAGDARLSIFLHLPRAPQAPLPEAVRAAIENCAHVVLDLSERSRDAAPLARAAGATVWTDLHDYDGESAYHQTFLDAAEHVFLSHDALGDPRPLMRRLVDGGKRLVVATLGPGGAVALDADGWHEVPAAPAHVVDTNGAGDAFLAGFLAATMAAAGVEDALRAGATQAARALGTRDLAVQRPLSLRPSEG